MDDRELLDQFVKAHSQGAFRELVERHLPVVYSAAQRLVRDAHLAEEVAQSVFTTLAQKADSIRPPQVLGGWLYNTTRHLAMHAVRTEQRRRERETTAFAMQALDQTPEDPGLTDHLEPALAELDAEDRDALVLRFLANRALREVGAELGVSEEAARKRVSRALERLRLVLEHRGVTATSVLLAAALTASTLTVPTGLGATITAAALAPITAAAVAKVSLLTMKSFGAKVAVAGIVLVCVGGAGTLIVQNWRARPDSAAAVAAAAPAHGAVTGHWDFDSGDLRATIGTPLRFMDEADGLTAKGTAFDTTVKFGLPAIGGEIAKVMRFPQMTARTMGYVVAHGAAPNGEGEKVNQYTILMDIFFPASSSGAFRSLIQTDNIGDADFYLNPANGIGISGDYAGNLTSGAWHRLVLVVDAGQRVPTVSKYVDGVKAASQHLSQGRDGRWSLEPAIGLFNDPNGESRAGYLNSLQIRDRALSDGEVRLLGGPSARGFPTNDLPEHPFVESTAPPANAFGVPVDSIIQAVISDGRSALKRDAVVLWLNGSRVSPEISRSGKLTTVSYQPSSPFTDITNSVLLTYSTGQMTVTNRWRFITSALFQKRSITGQWDFDQSNLVATIGVPLQYLDGPGGASQRACQFNTTTAFGISGINGAPAQVLSFVGALTPNIGLLAPHGAIPNGSEGPTRVNQWTLIMDILIPNARKEPWLALLQTDPENTSNADLFISFSREGTGIGSLGQYRGDGELVPGQWHRIAVAVDVGAFTMSKYIDGALFATQPLSATELDGRYSLAPTIVLFGDEDGDSQPAYLNSVQIRNYSMDESEIAALGGPDARGISTTPVR